MLTSLALLTSGCEKNDARNASGIYRTDHRGVYQEIHVDILSKVYSYVVTDQDGPLVSGSGKILLYQAPEMISKRWIGFQDVKWLPYASADESPQLSDPSKLRSLPDGKCVFSFEVRDS